MKYLLGVLAILLMAGCSSNEIRKAEFSDGAASCNEICRTNPGISEYSHKAGGGMPLLFMGGVEVKCGCNRTSK